MLIYTTGWFKKTAPQRIFFRFIFYVLPQKFYHLSRFHLIKLDHVCEIWCLYPRYFTRYGSWSKNTDFQKEQGYILNIKTDLKNLFKSVSLTCLSFFLHRKPENVSRASRRSLKHQRQVWFEDNVEKTYHERNRPIKHQRMKQDIDGNKQCFIKCTERLNLTNRARKLDFFDKIS